MPGPKTLGSRARRTGGRVTSQFDLAPFLDQEEGLHFERKSLYHGPRTNRRSRDRREVREQIAEYVAGFANAEGGVLILGLEDDGEITGHALPRTAVQSLLNTPRARLDPPQAPGFELQRGDERLLVFEVAASSTPVQVINDGFPMRVGDTTKQFKESQIEALKRQGLTESCESQRSSFGVVGMDRGLLALARERSGWSNETDEKYMLSRRLADWRGSLLTLRRAADLLFRLDGCDHPNAGVRIFRVFGAERTTGPKHNVEELPRIEGPLPSVYERSCEALQALIGRPSRLVGRRFVESLEYPDFAWREALLNALLHRDYSIEGLGTEVWLFSDRLEVVSPGNLPTGVTLEALLRFDRLHVSRNPRTVRVMADLGHARDQGEGIPRMFAEMEDAFLAPPEMSVASRQVRVVLRNSPALAAADREFIADLGRLDLERAELRALLQAHRHGRVDNSSIRSLVGLGTLAASKMLRRLREKGLLTLHSHGAKSYYSLPDAQAGRTGGVHEADDSEKAPLGWGDLPPAVQQSLRELTGRPRKKRLQALVLQICGARRWTSAAELAAMLRFSAPNLTRRHLSPMVKAQQLEMRHPNQPNHPKQAYRSTQPLLNL